MYSLGRQEADTPAVALPDSGAAVTVQLSRVVRGWVPRKSQDAQQPHRNPAHSPHPKPRKRGIHTMTLHAHPLLHTWEKRTHMTFPEEASTSSVEFFRLALHIQGAGRMVASCPLSQ